MDDLSVVIVNWNVKDLLRTCLQSVLTVYQDDPDLTAEIIVVDSASSDGSAQMVRQEFPTVRLIASDKNLGYARGNNIGVAAATGRYFFLLNPDTVIHAHALSDLVDYLDKHPNVGAVGPQLCWPDGTIQSSRRRFPTLGSLFWESTLLEQWFPGNRHARRNRLTDTPPHHTLAVDWLVGAALCIRREAWQQVGPLDENFFMYFEETDWCRRCVAAGWEIHYLPRAKVTHYEGKSSEQAMADRTLRFQRSKLMYARKYFGRTWASLLRLFLWLTYALQWLEESGKWLVGHRRDLRRERMVAYRQVLRDL
ncbi:MAG: glycosyltransferase family 2 protein [Anaerolineae bacterium]|nr:glycosyltransferase family 2 protein [Anaerolineae bacterium]